VAKARRSCTRCCWSAPARHWRRSSGDGAPPQAIYGFAILLNFVSAIATVLAVEVFHHLKR